MVILFKKNNAAALDSSQLLLQLHSVQKRLSRQSSLRWQFIKENLKLGLCLSISLF